MKKILTALILLLAANVANAQYVNWLDSPAYRKPQPVQVSQMSHLTATNRYWVDLTSGAGSTCSMASPCDSMDDVLGKNGIDCATGCAGSGGPAVIYVKGRGSMSWFDDTVRGTGDNDPRSGDTTGWILVRPWPAGSTGCATECTGTFTGNSNMNSANVHHIIFDGGPDMKIRFESSSAGQYAHHISGDYTLIYRTRMFCTANSGELGWQVGTSRVADYVYFINNEFYGCEGTGDQVAAIYASPGASGGYNHLYVINNICRNMGGECLEFNHRVTSSDVQVIGNVFHDNGFQTCNPSHLPSGWLCRPHVVFASQDGNPLNGITFANNVMWDSASGCVWFRTGGTPAPVVENNTCWNYNMHGPEDDDNPNPFGFEGNPVAAKNNILLPFTSGTNPFDSGTYTGATNNACASGETCGSSKQNWTTSEWLSTTENNLNFLRIGTSSVAKDNGTTGTVASPDFTGKTRPQGSAWDIGAFEYGTGGTSPPKAPVKQ